MWPDWTPKQQEFIMSRAKYPFMWGGWGAAKSWALCMRVILLSVKSDVFGDCQGNRGMLGRWTAKDLKDTTLKDLMELLPDSFIKGFNKQEMTIRLVGGSEIVLPHFENFKVGGNFCYAAIDQAEEVDQDTIERLQGRIRLRKTSKGRILPEWMRSVFGVGNPNGRSWHYRTWEVNRQLGERGHEGYDERYKCIPCTTYDNAQNLPADYIENLERTLTPKKLRIYVGGSWEAFEGQVYDEYDDQLCVSNTNVIPDSSWKKLVSIDHGYPAAKVATFMAIDPFYNGIIYDEVVMEEAKLEEFISAIRAKLVLHEREMAENEHRQPDGLEKVHLWPCDPSMRARSSQDDATLTFMKLYMSEAMRQDFKMPLFPADNAIEAGNDKVNWLFWNNHPDRASRNLPTLRVNPRAVQHRTAFSSYHYNTRTGKPADGQFDHPCDSNRYGVATVFQSDHFARKGAAIEGTFVDQVMKDMQLMKTQADLNAYVNESGWITSVVQ